MRPSSAGAVPSPSKRQQTAADSWTAAAAAATQQQQQQQQRRLLRPASASGRLNGRAGSKAQLAAAPKYAIQGFAASALDELGQRRQGRAAAGSGGQQQQSRPASAARACRGSRSNAGSPSRPSSAAGKKKRRSTSPARPGNDTAAAASTRPTSAASTALANGSREAVLFWEQALHAKKLQRPGSASGQALHRDRLGRGSAPSFVGERPRSASSSSWPAKPPLPSQLRRAVRAAQQQAAEYGGVAPDQDEILERARSFPISRPLSAVPSHAVMETTLRPATGMSCADGGGFSPNRPASAPARSKATRPATKHANGSSRTRPASAGAILQSPSKMMQRPQSSFSRGSCRTELLSNMTVASVATAAEPGGEGAPPQKEKAKASRVVDYHVSRGLRWYFDGEDSNDLPTVNGRLVLNAETDWIPDPSTLPPAPSSVCTIS
eukprot:TRINITY_DN14153_c0_g1_i1.p1 TRINITY_DN14153_c0_g1~~TRINITY_DN14153_c0_g1_i1.p1  ORF type:complete len:437 (-),score=95.54 TRINITY_DN14153_c0_g1_i1:53-1363(-)